MMATQQCTTMLQGFQFAFGSSSSSSHERSACLLYLFPGVHIDTPGKYVLAVLSTLVLSTCYELLRAHRENLVAVTAAAEKNDATPTSTTTTTPSHSIQVTTNNSDWDIVLVAVLYVIQSMIGYFLMILVMTFDLAFFMAILTGLGVGYYCVLRKNRSRLRRNETLANYKLMMASASSCATTNTEKPPAISSGAAA